MLFRATDESTKASACCDSSQKLPSQKLPVYLRRFPGRKSIHVTKSGGVLATLFVLSVLPGPGSDMWKRQTLLLPDRSSSKRNSVQRHRHTQRGVVTVYLWSVDSMAAPTNCLQKYQCNWWLISYFNTWMFDSTHGLLYHSASWHYLMSCPPGEFYRMLLTSN